MRQRGRRKLAIKWLIAVCCAVVAALTVVGPDRGAHGDPAGPQGNGASRSDEEGNAPELAVRRLFNDGAGSSSGRVWTSSTARGNDPAAHGIAPDEGDEVEPNITAYPADQLGMAAGLTSLLPILRRCESSYLSVGDYVTVTVAVVVPAGGPGQVVGVDDVVVVDSEPASPGFVACLSNVVRELRFEAPPTEQVVEYEHRIGMLGYSE